MPQRKTTRKKSSSRPKKPSYLDRLSDAESAQILHRLLAAHKALRAEAEAMAAEILCNVAFEDVADELQESLTEPGYPELNARSGTDEFGGYTDAVDAAWEILKEALEPFLDDMLRCLETGLVVEATEHCKGILLGLYRVSDAKQGDVLQWAPDFPYEAAQDIMGRFLYGDRKEKSGKANKHTFPTDFLDKHTPGWSDLGQSR